MSVFVYECTWSHASSAALRELFQVGTVTESGWGNLAAESE